MTIRSGSNTVQSGLIFHYDIGNTQKSWKGKPTTNLVGNPFMSNGTAPTSIAYTGYEGTATIVVAPNNQCAAISPYWIKYVKNSPSNGRIWFLSMSGLTPTTDYTYGCYVYTTDSQVTGFTLGSDNGGISNTTSNITTWASTDLGTIKRISSVFQSVGGGTSNGCRITAGDASGTTFYMTGFQCELGNFPTPVVNGTRSNTQSLIDVSFNNTINVSTLPFTSNTISFNGTSSYLNPTISLSYLSSNCCEFMLKVTSLPNAGKYTGLFGWTHNPGYSQPTIGLTYINSSGVISASCITWSQTYRTVVGPTLSTNTYYHVCLNRNMSTGVMDLYINGEFSATQTFTAADFGQWTVAGSYIGSSSLDIGRSSNTSDAQGWGSFSYLNGEIPVAKVYSRVLTSSEIKQNFNALRGRFGI